MMEQARYGAWNRRSYSTSKVLGANKNGHGSSVQKLWYERTAISKNSDLHNI